MNLSKLVRRNKSFLVLSAKEIWIRNVGCWTTCMTLANLLSVDYLACSDSTLSAIKPVTVRPFVLKKRNEGHGRCFVAVHNSHDFAV